MEDEHDAGSLWGSVGVIRARAYARIGLLGNPSDGYFGKTISVSIQNFYAEVALTPNQQPFSAVGEGASAGMESLPLSPPLAFTSCYFFFYLRFDARAVVE
jgi:hypothetical protein